MVYLTSTMDYGMQFPRLDALGHFFPDIYHGMKSSGERTRAMSLACVAAILAWLSAPGDALLLAHHFSAAIYAHAHWALLLPLLLAIGVNLLDRCGLLTGRKLTDRRPLRTARGRSLLIAALYFLAFPSSFFLLFWVGFPRNVFLLNVVGFNGMLALSFSTVTWLYSGVRAFADKRK